MHPTVVQPDMEVVHRHVACTLQLHMSMIYVPQNMHINMYDSLSLYGMSLSSASWLLPALVHQPSSLLVVLEFLNMF